MKHQEQLITYKSMETSKKFRFDSTIGEIRSGILIMIKNTLNANEVKAHFMSRILLCLTRFLILSNVSRFHMQSYRHNRMNMTRDCYFERRKIT